MLRRSVRSQQHHHHSDDKCVRTCNVGRREREGGSRVVCLKSVCAASCRQLTTGCVDRPLLSPWNDASSHLLSLPLSLPPFLTTLFSASFSLPPSPALSSSFTQPFTRPILYISILYLYILHFVIFGELHSPETFFILLASSSSDTSCRNHLIHISRLSFKTLRSWMISSSLNLAPCLFSSDKLPEVKETT